MYHWIGLMAAWSDAAANKGMSGQVRAGSLNLQTAL